MNACAHEEFQGSITIVKSTGTGRNLAEVRIICAACRTPFEFGGMPRMPEANFRTPTRSMCGFTARLPIQPAHESALPERVDG